jgi:hypothetical protein
MLWLKKNGKKFGWLSIAIGFVIGVFVLVKTHQAIPYDFTPAGITTISALISHYIRWSWVYGLGVLVFWWKTGLGILWLIAVCDIGIGLPLVIPPNLLNED